MNKFTVPAQITSIRPLVDKSYSITAHTNELRREEGMILIDSLNMVGWLLFSENEIKEEEIPHDDAELEQKTPSQRLRGVFYRVWEQQGSQGDFNSFYRLEMERIINHYKEKLG